LLIFDEVTDKTKLAPFFMAHGVHVLQPLLKLTLVTIYLHGTITRKTTHVNNSRFIIRML